MAKITDPLVLSADVQMVSVADLPEDVSKHLEWEEGDVAIDRLRSRTPSKVISAQSAELVEEFNSPKKIVEAILHYSLKNGADPRETLQEAFPVLQQLIAAGLLVPADSPAADHIELTMQTGDQIELFTVVSPVHILEDIEIYQARNEDGKTVALKITRPEVGPSIERMLAQEAAVLKKLNGTISPEFIETGTFQNRLYLVMDWCEGTSVEAVATELRQDSALHSRFALLSLGESILRTYANLHNQGIIHGDIHPNNILVDGNGTVRLIDFGLSQEIDSAYDLWEVYRGGIAFFYEPEYADALRSGNLPPPASESGEQYSLAVLLYYLFTGQYYLDFSLEQDEMLRQIVDYSPKPLDSLSEDPWPSAVEQAMARALSKNPVDRYKDVATFAIQLNEVAEALKLETPEIIEKPQLDSTARDFQANVLARVGWNGSVFVGGLPKSPTTSINMGAAGIAYTLYRTSCSQGDPTLLALADAWGTRAALDIGDDNGFYNADVELTPETVGLISPYHTPSGVFAAQALIAQARSDRMAEEIAVHGFVEAASRPCENLDLTLGISGLLVVGALLFEALNDHGVAERTGLLSLGNSTLRKLWKTLDSYPSIRETHELTNLGIAHGWGGMLYATLRWCEATSTPYPDQTQERLNQLAGLAESIGRGVRWPWQLDSPGLYMPGWCNGSAGYVFLWTLAHRTFSDLLYQNLAEKAAWNCWEDPAQIASLCCGLTGRAYALLHMYKYSGDSSWLRRALVLTNQAAVNIRSLQPEDEKGFENSLYKGDLGVAALIADFENPKGAALPLFESEGWTNK